MVSVCELSGGFQNAGASGPRLAALQASRGALRGMGGSSGQPHCIQAIVLHEDLLESKTSCMLLKERGQLFRGEFLVSLSQIYVEEGCLKLF